MTRRSRWAVAGTLAGAGVLGGCLGGRRGAVAAVAYASWPCVLLRGRPVSLADAVTLTRTVLGAGCAAVVATGEADGPRLVGLGTAAWLLDGADGAVARRRGTASAAGQRLDVAVDSQLVLVLSLAAWHTWRPAPVAGLLRYAFLAGAVARPAWRAPLPPSRRRRVVGVAQGLALLLAAAPGVAEPARRAALVVAAAALMLSFGRDVHLLEQADRLRRPPRVGGGA